MEVTYIVKTYAIMAREPSIYTINKICETFQNKSEKCLVKCYFQQLHKTLKYTSLTAVNLL